MDKVTEFFNLQKEVNEQIDRNGIADTESVNKLEVVGDSLTAKEIEEVCERARAENLYQQGMRHY